jgi:hypothetical protein
MTNHPGDLPPQGRRRAKDVVLSRYTDARGKTVVRPGSPVLFLIVCAVLFWGFYRVDSNDCQRYQHLEAYYDAQAARALSRAQLENGRERALDLRAYYASAAAAVEFSRCPSILP